MKKLLLLLVLGLILNACKQKDAPVIEYGTMSLSPKESTLFYGQTVIIKPTLSATGIVNDKKFNWSVSDPNVLAYQATTIGGNLEVTANRISSTPAYVRYISTDGVFKDSVKITVNQRQSFRKIFFEKGAPLRSILDDEGKSAADSIAGNYYYFNRDVTTTQIFKKVIYRIENGGLVATYAVLENNTKNYTIISQYMDERFRSIGDTKGKISAKGVTFFDANVAPQRMYSSGTFIGAFEDNTQLIPDGKALPLGIVIIDQTKI